MPRFWVVGPIAWDWTFQVDRVPESGGFVQARSARGRPGGTGANTAAALASARADVRMVGYVGRDGIGQRMLATLRDHLVDTAFVRQLDGHTSQVLLLVEPDGERTIIGVHCDLMSSVTVPVDAIGPDDVVYFAAWREAFVQAMTELVAKGAVVATVPPEPGWTRLPAAYVIGSESHHRAATPDVEGAYAHLLTAGPLRCVVVTCGSSGAVAYCRGRRVHQPARSVTPVDQTGAGDAFVAGFLHQVARGSSVEEALRVGTKWGTTAVLVPESIPPPWSAIAPPASQAAPPEPQAPG
jgi:sugar/nucleoside kinase (ribokinase family)